MYYIPQITSNDCLFTSFKILLANVKGDEKYLYLQEDEKHGAYSLFEIIEKAKTFGVELFGFETDDKRELKNCKNIPLILNIKRGTQNLHSVYVYKVTNKKVYYLDSDVGKTILSFEKFIAMWNGTGLMTRTVNEVKKEAEPIFIKTEKNPFSKVFQAISAISFIFGIYFIDGRSDIILPILLILFGIFAEVFAKIIQIKDMKKFDKQTIQYLKGIKSEYYSEFLPRREKLKLSLFSSKNNYFFYLLSCAFAIFIILLNNPFNIACVFVPITLAILQSLVIAPLEKRKDLEIEILEAKFAHEKNKESAEKVLSQLESNSYKFTHLVLGKNVLGITLFFVASFVTLKILNAFDLINTFFLMFTEIFLYQNMLPIFSYESRKVEEKFNYMKFINLLQ